MEFNALISVNSRPTENIVKSEPKDFKSVNQKSEFESVLEKESNSLKKVEKPKELNSKEVEKPENIKKPEESEKPENSEKLENDAKPVEEEKDMEEIEIPLELLGKALETNDVVVIDEVNVEEMEIPKEVVALLEILGIEVETLDVKDMQKMSKSIEEAIEFIDLKVDTGLVEPSSQEKMVLEEITKIVSDILGMDIDLEADDIKLKEFVAVMLNSDNETKEIKKQSNENMVNTETETMKPVDTEKVDLLKKTGLEVEVEVEGKKDQSPATENTKEIKVEQSDTNIEKKSDTNIVTVTDNQNLELEEVKQVEIQKTSPVSSKNVMEQIVDGTKTTLKVNGDTSEMTLKLKPDHLGELSLKVKVHNGVITAEFNVESHTVKQILESNMNLLKDVLAEKGMSIDSLEVSVGSDGNNPESNQQRQNRSFTNDVDLSKIDEFKDIGFIRETLYEQSTIDFLG